MKWRLFQLTILAFIAALLAFRLQSPPVAKLVARQKIAAIGCSPDWAAITPLLEASDIPPIPGAGSHRWVLSSKNDSARFYFNQGMNLYYSFHIIESMASFKKAAKFDPDCALIYWAQALAYGPNINDMGYAASPDALAATEKAIALSSGASIREKALIDAMSVRYTADSTDVNRQQLNQAYTAKMAALFKQYPQDGDIGTLYADAMMLEHPWDLWTIDGKPKPWTPRIQEVLERVLQSDPDNPGANHYYIHVMEPSPFAAKALTSADRLGHLTPGLSHTVHMPSHIYLRTGHYQKGVQVNRDAVSRYKANLPLFPAARGADFLYLIHNLHMQTNTAMLMGQADLSIHSAKELEQSIPKPYLKMTGPLGSLIQYIYYTHLLVDLRFGRWSEILATPEPPAEQTYARVLWNMSRGIALVRMKQTAEAKVALGKIDELMKDSVLAIPFSPFSPALDGARVARELLNGSIQMAEKNTSLAIAAFEKAVATEAAMVYNEPRDWLLNPRHYLADALLQAGSTAKARQVLQDDLAVNNNNFWALCGLLKIAKAEKKKTEADQLLQKIKTTFPKTNSGYDLVR